MIARRTLLGSIPALGLGAALRPALAADQVLRVGYQKGEAIGMVAKQRRALDAHLEPLDVRAEWVEFEYGPPMLEAMRAGSIDVGGVGDTPPIFAQAARADLLYVAAISSGASAILVPPGSKLGTLADLRGRRIAFALGSSAHNLTLAALEKAGIPVTDVEPLYLAPADAAAAFERGGVDAWAIWDPYYAIYEAKPGVRVLARSADIVPQTSFLMARHAFVDANPNIIGNLVATLGQTGVWAAAHRPEVAKMLADATGIPEAVMLRSLQRDPLRVVPISETYARAQQEEADRFHRLGIIPTAIDVHQEIWHAGA